MKKIRIYKHAEDNLLEERVIERDRIKQQDHLPTQKNKTTNAVALLPSNQNSQLCLLQTSHLLGVSMYSLVGGCGGTKFPSVIVKKQFRSSWFLAVSVDFIVEDKGLPRHNFF